MKAATFEYVRPKDLSEALEQLACGRGDAKAIAGGQSLGPMLNLRLARPRLLVDISKLDALRRIDDEGDAWSIGAAVTHAELEDQPLAGCTPLAGVARGIAYRSVRNRGTIGGSLAHADPAGDWPLALAALGATVLVAGPKGRRQVEVCEFTRSAFASVLADDELVERVRIPKLSLRARWGYYKFCRKTGDFPDASAAVLLDPERRTACVYAGALDRPPLSLDTLANQLAREGAVSNSEVETALARLVPGIGPAALRLRATVLHRAIEESL